MHYTALKRDRRSLSCSSSMAMTAAFMPYGIATFRDHQSSAHFSSSRRLNQVLNQDSTASQLLLV
jgi:hypothetical protein